MTLLDTIPTLPKVVLHDHLDGGLRPETIIDLAAQVGHTLPATDPAALKAWFVESADSGSLERYLETFDHTIAVMQTAPALTRVAREAVMDLAADGVIYAESRWAPEQHLRGGLTLDEAVEAVQRGFAEGVDLAAREGHSIEVGQLVTAMRHADRWDEIADLALRHRDKGVYGFDIAGAEAGFMPDRFPQVWRRLNDENFPVTIHAGEAAGAESIAQAVHLGQAQRVGHGVRIIDDITGLDTDTPVLGRLANWVRDNQIALEMCPCSNLQTGAAQSIASHPITRLRDLDFAVTINTDNRLMSGTSMSHEMRLLVSEAGWDIHDLLNATLVAAWSTFTHHDARLALGERIITAFEEIHDGSEQENES
ncbi:adenosine deaminase [Jonesia quinghaiensis]|uniref:adenosine deaminase n=1 Tax=Jonesia quinghaiensis TaxID=262806 RepID=UPI00040A4397|nr:adenosine deaminase [Jonesia quinghaiensis]